MEALAEATRLNRLYLTLDIERVREEARYMCYMEGVAEVVEARVA